MYTYVAPNKFETVLSIPESAISEHSISYEMKSLLPNVSTLPERWEKKATIVLS